MLRGRGEFISRRYYDLLHPKERIDFDAQEVIERVASNAGLEVIGE